jgi:hypothetical protein
MALRERGVQDFGCISRSGGHMIARLSSFFFRKKRTKVLTIPNSGHVSESYAQQGIICRRQAIAANNSEHDWPPRAPIAGDAARVEYISPALEWGQRTRIAAARLAARISAGLPATSAAHSLPTRSSCEASGRADRRERSSLMRWGDWARVSWCRSTWRGRSGGPDCLPWCRRRKCCYPR